MSLSVTNPIYERHRDNMLGLPPRYCLFDFDVSIAFPFNIPIEQCRLNADESWLGFPWYTPFDTSQGELDYDPFSYDVIS